MNLLLPYSTDLDPTLKVPKHEIFGFGVISSKKPPYIGYGSWKFKKKLFFKIISCLYFRFYGPQSAYAYD